MFTGIIEDIGRVTAVQESGGGRLITVASGVLSPQLKVNDSVSINGACHTAVRADPTSFDVFTVEETLLKTNFGKLKENQPVNLELPVKMNDRLGGHLVLGHVDAVGGVIHIERRESSSMFAIRFDTRFSRYLIPVGSVSVDGVSLTVAGISGDHFLVSIIPHTFERTIFSTYHVGTVVNLEFDMVGKYIERMASARTSVASDGRFPSETDLKQQGF